MDNILRAGLMCRVSTDEQALHGDSLQAQEEALVQFAEDNNMKVYKVYRDEGFSARKPVLKRPAMLELLEDVKAGKIDIILFTKLDRWFRNIKEYHTIQEILERNKVYWKAILEDYNTATADGRLKVNIMLSVAENEADRTSERIKFVFNSKIMRGETIFSSYNAPLGYTVVKINGVNKLVKDDETREIVEYFFKTALTSSVRQAAIQTQQKYNIHRDASIWYRMAHNELYAGSYRGLDNYCEPYVTQAQLDEITKVKTIRKAKNNRIYLFSGMIVCPECGAMMISKYSNSSSYKSKEFFYYRCPKRILKECTAKSIAEPRVEKYILENIEKELEKFILSHEVSQQKTPNKKTDTAKLKEQLRRVNVSYQAGNMEDDEYLAKTKELKVMIEKATKEENRENNVDVEALKDFLNSGFVSIYDSLEKEEQQRLWRSIIDKINYDGDGFAGIKFKV